MQLLYDVYFVSSNRHKYLEAKDILISFGIKLGFYKLTLEEIQSDSLNEIAKKKAIHAFQKCKKPIIIEDDGIFVNSLNGFPGPYSSFIFKTIKNKGILKLVGKDRTAKFISIISYHDKKIAKTFDATIHGTISKKEQGSGWGYDPIFIPNNKNKTFAQLSDKNKISHRYKALKKFSSWYLNKLESYDQ